jgi:phage tail-like protein
MTQNFRAIFRLSGPEIQEDTLEITDAQFVIGRLDDNELTLKHNKISRQHARLLLGEQGVALEDLDSSNGTTVNDERLNPNEPRLLQKGDGIGIGPFTLIFEDFIVGEDTKEAEAEAAPPPQQAAPDNVPAARSTPAPQTATSDNDITAEQKLPVAPPPGADVPAVPPPNGQAPTDANGHMPEHLRGLPAERSNWMDYLPAIYSENSFFEKFLLIFEAGFAPYEWIIDNFDLYLDAKMAPPEWLQWFGSWVDILVPADIPEERQHSIVRELGPLFMARGTRKSLVRHLQLVFDVTPDIDEPDDEFATFVVKLPLGADQNTAFNRDLAEAIIEAQQPIHTTYRLIIE